MTLDPALYRRLYLLLAPLAGGDWENTSDLPAAMRRMEPEAAALLDEMEQVARPEGAAPSGLPEG